MVKRFTRFLSENKILPLLILSATLLVSLYKDILYSVAMPADMRNRIIGARMMEDGLSPYFYIRPEGASPRYYDTYVSPKSYVSPVTSTPFFHFVTETVADFPQFKLNTLWFVLQYFCLGWCCIMAIQSAPPERRNRMAWLLATIAVLFTYTIGWRIHINVGQNYIFIPVMAMGAYYCLTRKSNGLHVLLFGVFAVSLILLRPIAVMFFVPFIWYLKPYLKWGLTAAVLMATYIAFVWTSPVQKTNWQDYFKSVQVHIKAHQEELPPVPYVKYNPVEFHSFEGIDFNSEGSLYYTKQLKKGSENSSFFIFYKAATGKKISVTVANIISLIVGGLMVLPLFWVKAKRITLSAGTLLLLGFALYNMFEFFTPVTRIAYHWVQFLFPLLIAPLCMKRVYLLPSLLLLTGFYFNIVVWPSVKMEHSIGEFLITIGILLLVYRKLLMKYVREEKLRVNEEVYYL